MVNAILMRMHLSGEITKMTDKKFDLIKEGVSYYKKIRKYKNEFLPFYPYGLTDTNASVTCVGYSTKDMVFYAFWKFDDKKSEFKLPLKYPIKSAIIGYPENTDSMVELTHHELIVNIKSKNSAIIIECER